MTDLLTDSIIPVAYSNRQATNQVSLPELFSLLVDDSVESFPGLARHQAQPWYQFLAQLGAIALHRAGQSLLPTAAAEWQIFFAALTPHFAETAWSLVVEDASKPALLQPPTKMINAFKPIALTPDTLDILVTAKNHDRKQARAAAGAPHLWLYALVALQTSQGFSGRGNPGIARMNGGFSSRVLVDRRPNARWGPRIERAIRMLLGHRSRVLENDYLYRTDDGLALTWLEYWDTDSQISLSDLDPYFIEVCRRVRLALGTDDCLRALGRSATMPRVAAKALKGNLGDPWVPINLGKAEQSSLTVSATGYDYRLAQRILLGKDLSKPLALRALPGEEKQDSEIHMAVLVRGQGKTEGIHERIIPLAHSVATMLFEGEDQDGDEDGPSLALLSKQMVSMAGEARKVLRRAVLVYLQGPENPNFKKDDAKPVVAHYDRIIDDRFFEHLFDAPDKDIDEIDNRWQRLLKDEAIRVANKVWSRSSPPSSRREKAQAKSEAVLYGGLYKCLPNAFTSPDSSESTQ